MTDGSTPSGAWARRVAERLDGLRAEGRWRAPRTFDANGPAGALDGRPVVSFASNDYLGLTRHPAVARAAEEAIERWGTGAGASRLITGSRPVHDELEAELARATGCERAVVFPSGFATNLGVLTAFGEPGTLVCSDELNHASIVDGTRLARAEVAVYRHVDVEHLATLLQANAGRRLVVVTDLVFSMDGDVAPLSAIAELCRRHDALLVLDEAHAVLGPDPAPMLQGVDAVRVGTLSKTLGALGGYAAGPAPFMALLENCARSYIFTTALPPADAAAALAALRIVHGAEGDALRTRLRGYVEQLRPGHPTPIVPVVLGAEETAVAASEALLADGLWVPAIRPPTVAPGTSRLRVTLSAAHEPADVDRLAAALSALVAGASR
ncbi:MAG TPA: 8-amino-7-oxononanoate synthase [Acidimicrobiales bacterium]|nr:8-amino-7-oxononanoate synthase [Acidimicrobiales bacterium]